VKIEQITKNSIKKQDLFPKKQILFFIQIQRKSGIQAIPLNAVTANFPSPCRSFGSFWEKAPCDA